MTGKIEVIENIESIEEVWAVKHELYSSDLSGQLEKIMTPNLDCNVNKQIIVPEIVFNLKYEENKSSDPSDFSPGALNSGEDSAITSNDEQDTMIKVKVDESSKMFQLDKKPISSIKVENLPIERELQFNLFKISESKALILINAMNSTTLLQQLTPSSMGCALYKAQEKRYHQKPEKKVLFRYHEKSIDKPFKRTSRRPIEKKFTINVLDTLVK